MVLLWDTFGNIQKKFKALVESFLGQGTTYFFVRKKKGRGGLLRLGRHALLEIEVRVVVHQALIDRVVESDQILLVLETVL